jgi:hypothetical protein
MGTLHCMMIAEDEQSTYYDGLVSLALVCRSTNQDPIQEKSIILHLLYCNPAGRMHASR